MTKPHDKNPPDPAPLQILGIPVRIDATLCDPGEIFLEHVVDGTVQKVTGPEPQKGSDDGR